MISNLLRYLFKFAAFSFICTSIAAQASIPDPNLNPTFRTLIKNSLLGGPSVIEYESNDFLSQYSVSPLIHFDLNLFQRLSERLTFSFVKTISNGLEHMYIHSHLDGNSIGIEFEIVEIKRQRKCNLKREFTINEDKLLRIAGLIRERYEQIEKSSLILSEIRHKIEHLTSQFHETNSFANSPELASLRRQEDFLRQMIIAPKFTTSEKIQYVLNNSSFELAEVIDAIKQLEM